jgi:hypothetical protein
MRSTECEIQDILGRLLLEQLQDGQRKIACRLEDLQIDRPALKNDRSTRKDKKITKFMNVFTALHHTHTWTISCVVDHVANTCQCKKQTEHILNESRQRYAPSFVPTSMMGTDGA